MAIGLTSSFSRGFRAGERPATPPLWTFNTPQTGTVLSGFRLTTTDGTSIIVRWGDGTQSTVNSNTPFTKTY